jgi:hypothetical protein
MAKEKKEVTAKDACVKICQTIWSCKNEEQKDACYNMFETYKQQHGDENVGVTLIQMELARLEHIIVVQTQRMEQMKAAQDRQQAAMQAEDKANPPQPSGTDGKVIPIKNIVPNSAKGNKKE